MKTANGKDVALSEIKVIWCQPVTGALWGIPYDMRPGQSPYDLFRCGRALGRYWECDWLYLGRVMTRTPDDQAAVDAFLAEHKDDIPQSPCEWSRLDT